MIFYPLHTDIKPPGQFNNPFYYEPHPLCEMAAAYGGADSPAGLDTYRWLGTDVLRSRLNLAPRFSLAAGSAPAVDEAQLKLLGHG